MADDRAVKAGGASVELSADMTRLMPSLSKAEASMTGWAARLASRLGVIIGGAVGAAFAKTAVLAAAEQDKLNISLAGGLAQGGDTSDAGYRRAIKFAEAQARSVLASKESIQSAMAQAAAQGFLGDRLEDVARAAVGWATTMGTDVPSAMGQVLAGVNGFGRGLTRYGLDLDKVTDKEERLRMLIDASGAGYQRASIEVQGLSGALNQSGKAWGEFKERAGTGITVAIGGPETFERIAVAVDGIGVAAQKAGDGFAGMIDVLRGGWYIIDGLGRSIIGITAQLLTLGRFGKEITKSGISQVMKGSTREMNEAEIRAWMKQNGHTITPEFEAMLQKKFWAGERKPMTGGSTGAERPDRLDGGTSIGTIAAAALPGWRPQLSSIAPAVATVAREVTKPATADMQQAQLDALNKIAANTGAPLGAVAE